MRCHSPSRKPRRGFNLIEAAIVLGVVGLVIGGIWIAASNVMEKKRESRMIEEVLQVTGKLRSSLHGIFFPDGAPFSLFGIAHDSWELYFPADMIDGGNYPRTPWGTRVMADVRSNPDMIVFNLELPLSTCISLSPRLYASIQSNFVPGSTVPMYTQSEGLDVSTPQLAAENCPIELAVRGEIVIVFGLTR